MAITKSWRRHQVSDAIKKLSVVLRKYLST